MKTKQQKLTPFGKKVRKRLIDKGMTQVELAALLGCNKQYIHKILVGERSGKKYIEEISRMSSRASLEAVGVAKVLKVAIKLREFSEMVRANGETEYKLTDQYNYIKDILDA